MVRLYCRHWFGRLMVGSHSWEDPAQQQHMREVLTGSPLALHHDRLDEKEISCCMGYVAAAGGDAVRSAHSSVSFFASWFLKLSYVNARQVHFPCGKRRLSWNRKGLG